MGNNYKSNLIGLDVKPRRQGRVRKNRSRKSKGHRWLLPVVVLVATVGVFLLVGAR